MMAGVKTANRARYTSAGYNARREQELYIARAQAGSAQEALVDLNKRGYRSERPWNETPVPAFEGAAAQEVAAPVRRRAKTQKKKGFSPPVAPSLNLPPAIPASALPLLPPPVAIKRSSQCPIL